MLRQIDLQGPQRRPVTPPCLAEVPKARDHADLAAMAAYERKYGVLGKVGLHGWRLGLATLPGHDRRATHLQRGGSEWPPVVACVAGDPFVAFRPREVCVLPPARPGCPLPAGPT